LQERGWIDGRSLRIDLRGGAGDAERLRAYASELVGLKPDVILAGGSGALGPLHRETQMIPIVFAQVADPGWQRLRDKLGATGWQHHGFQPI
jgi:putative tryptophan/tyrosine transport system substrate-binding protein